MPNLMTDVLSAGHEADRLLDSVPATSPDHETVARLVVELRQTYVRLWATSDSTQQRVLSTRETLDSSRVLLDAVRHRHARHQR